MLEPMRTASNAEPEALDIDYADSVRALPKAPADQRLPSRRSAFIDGFSQAASRSSGERVSAARTESPGIVINVPRRRRRS